MYAVDSFIEVLADGLAVRTGPGTDHPLAAEFLLHQDPVSVEKVRDAVRLPAGHVVRVELGPLVVGDRAWYAVHNVAQDGQAVADVASWGSRPPGPGDYFEPRGWRLRNPVPNCPTHRPSGIGMPVLWRHARAVGGRDGVGDGRVGPWDNNTYTFIQIAASPVSEADTCDFWVSGRDGDPPLISEVGTDTFETLLPSIDVAPGMDEAVRVSGDCAWAIAVDPAQ